MMKYAFMFLKDNKYAYSKASKYRTLLVVENMNMNAIWRCPLVRGTNKVISYLN